MRRLVLIPVLGLSAFLMSCTAEHLSEEKVVAALDTIEHKLEWLEYRLAEEQWEYLTTGESDSLEFFERLYEQIVGSDPSYDLLRQGRGLLSNDMVSRRAQLVFARLLVGKIEAHPKVIALLESSGSRGLTPKPFTGEPPPRIFVDVARGSKRNDRASREVNFRTYASVGIDPQLSPQLVRLRNQLARREGYNNYFALAAAGLRQDVPEYLQLLKQLEQASRVAYRTILDELSSELAGNQPEMWDLGLVLYPDAELELERYLPRDSQLTFAHRTCGSMGVSLKQLPLFWHDKLRGQAFSRVQCLPIKPPYDVRMWGYNVEGVNGSSILMGQIGRALHALNISQERALFVNELHPYWREGVTRLFASLCLETAWLEQFANAPPALGERYLAQERKAQVVSLRILLAHLKFEYELYTNSERDLNKLYWNIIEQHLLIPRHDELVIWPHVEVYSSHPVELQAALYGDMIAAQTKAYLEKQYGGLLGNSDTYSFLVQNYMRFGSRYPWEELLERGTDERLNPRYLIAKLGL